MELEKSVEKDQGAISVSPFAKVKVYWDDKPEEYSREAKSRVVAYFAKKYGLSKTNVNVVFRPVKIDKDGKMIEIDGASIDNIMDVNYQHSLFKEWLEREQKDVDFNRILKLDNSVNASLDVDLTAINHRKWRIKWLSINNFLCFGDGNFINFGKLNGMTIVNSIPTNQGGKTTFNVDAVKFLFFGKTTKTDKNEQIFNHYSDGNEVVVRGMVDYDDKEIIIERKLTRKAKRAGGFNVSSTLTYYLIMPDGEEIELGEEDSIATTSEIKKTIGEESDFDITILTTANNLEDLIQTSSTESGKLLTKFIGIEVIEKKEKIAREMYNTFAKTMKSNQHNIETLKNDIETHKTNISENQVLLKNRNSELELVKGEITELNDKKDKLLATKKAIDVTISQLNPTTIQTDIDTITKSGKDFSVKIEELTTKIKEIGDVTYDEVAYFNETKSYNTLDAKIAQMKTEKENHLKMVDQLKNGELCPTCKRPLEDVDHSGEIKLEEEKAAKLTTSIETSEEELSVIKGKIDGMSEARTKMDNKNRLELQKDRYEVDRDQLRNQIKAKKDDLAKYKANEATINFNIEKDIEIQKVKTDIQVKETEKDVLLRTIQSIEFKIANDEQQILDKENLIVIITKEKEVERIFKIYIDMVGKKGISKLILRSVLPIINSELYRLMEDVCDFTVELNINSKNDIEFVINKDGVDKLLKSGSGFEKTTSSIALRCVLGKMSYLPMPNFITFDEVFGKVSDENKDKLKPMFDKIRDMFDIVFIITHEDKIKDWGDNIITVRKPNNISSLIVK